MSKIILESNELINVQPYKLSRLLIKQLSEFQQFVSLISLKEYSYREVVELYEKIKPFEKHRFAKGIVQLVTDYLKETEFHKSTQYEIENKSRINEIKHALLHDNLKSFSLENIRHLNHSLIKLVYHNKESERSFIKFRGLKKGSMDMLFSGGEMSGLLPRLDNDTLYDIIHTDLNNKYTYLLPVFNEHGQIKLPEDTSELEYFAYLILNLKDTPKHVRLFAREYEVYKRWTDDSYVQLRKHVKEFIRNNNKESILHIKELMTPEIRKAMKVALRGKQFVYRGIGGSFTNEDIRKNEKQYVSTTPSHSTAERFAKGIGHLDDMNSSRFSDGVILTYDISNFNSVIFYTPIFGTVYGEVEALIDTQVAELVDIEQFNFN